MFGNNLKILCLLNCGLPRCFRRLAVVDGMPYHDIIASQRGNEMRYTIYTLPSLTICEQLSRVEAAPMSQSTQIHHSCVACASRLLFSFSSCPRKGSFYTVGDYGQEVYLFNLLYDQAVAQARQGCEFMEWFISMPSVGIGTRLRAALSNVGVIQLCFEWVTGPNESVLGGVEAMTLCASERYTLGSPHYPTQLKLTTSSDAAALRLSQDHQISIRHPEKQC